MTTIEEALLPTKKSNCVCKVCSTTFYSKWGNRKHTCSKECLKKLKSTDEYKTNLVKKQRAAFMKKYGVDNPAKSLLIKEKTKQTCLERYGAVSPTLNTEVRKKQNSTCMKRYGANTPLESKEITLKTKASLLKSFGVECPFLSEKIQVISKETKIKKYGDVNYNNVAKAKASSMKKYGVDNPMKCLEIQEKAKQTFLRKYGVEYIQQSKEHRKKSIATNLKRYGVDNPAKNTDIKSKTVASNLKKYGTSYPIGNKVVQEKVRMTTFKNYYNSVITKKFSSIVEPLFTANEYVGNISYVKKYPFRCIKCNNKFEDTLCSSHVPRCKICYPVKVGISNVEKELLSFIRELLPVDYLIIENDRKILSGKELDVYLPDKKLAIEFDGLFWHSEIGGKKSINYHLSKTEECEKLGIKLIHVFEDEWINSQNIIKDRLKHLLNVRGENIYARKCEVKEISGELCDAFLDLHHLQGSDKSKVKLGAFYKEELLAVMTFGANRIALGNSVTPDECELYRFCSSKNVVGAAGKLLTHFIKNYSPKKITTYSDRRYSSIHTNFYTKIGFKFVDVTNPNYWYTKDYETREYRFKYRKSELPKLLIDFDPSLTEWENMQQNGYDRIWDCGHLKYEMMLSKS